MSKTEIEEMLNMSKREFIKQCKQYIAEERGGKLFEVDDPGKCPLAIWVAYVRCAEIRCAQIAETTSLSSCHASPAIFLQSVAGTKRRGRNLRTERDMRYDN